MPQVVNVRAPSRLHFGLWALRDGEGRQFGGVGAMIARPATELTITASPALSVTGLEPERTLAAVRRWAAFHGRSLPSCRIEVRAAPPAHAGLGTGTQLALSVAAGLSALCHLPSQSPRELAISVGRGNRSAVGTYGFAYGGLIVEQGKLPGEPIAPLDCRIDLPENWRFVLVRPAGASGLAGELEAQAFHTLPAVPAEVTSTLIAEVRDHLVPAAATHDFAAFAASLYRYGNLSGQCFAARQGGAYNGPVLAALVEHVRGLGYAGVGQSSWGPTIFVAAESAEAAKRLAAQLQGPLPVDGLGELAVEITPPCNSGAQIDAGEDGHSLSVARHDDTERD